MRVAVFRCSWYIIHIVQISLRFQVNNVQITVAQPVLKSIENDAYNSELPHRFGLV